MAFPYHFSDARIAFGGTEVTLLQAIILGVCSALMIGLHLFISRTRVGKAMRATAQDRVMASLVGINVNSVIAATFIIGAALAAIAGVMVGAYYGLVNYFIGYIAGIKAFTAAVLGGIGSIRGAMLGGIVLGLVESIGSAYLSSEYKDAFAFVILIIILMVRPTGIFGRQVVEKV
jgi:branched-chain amino acid transport system permease protein